MNMIQFQSPLSDSWVQLASSNIMKTSDLSRKKLAEVESEVEVKYYIGRTTGETGFHLILCAPFNPSGDLGKKLDQLTKVRLFIPN